MLIAQAVLLMPMLMMLSDAFDTSDALNFGDASDVCDASILAMQVMIVIPSQLSACEAPAHQAQPLPGECKYPTLLVFPALTPRAVGTGCTMRGRLARRE